MAGGTQIAHPVDKQVQQDSMLCFCRLLPRFSITYNAISLETHCPKYMMTIVHTVYMWFEVGSSCANMVAIYVIICDGYDLVF